MIKAEWTNADALDLQPTCNQLATDSISRQAAIDFIDAGHLVNPNEPRWSDNEIVNFLKSRPFAQPESHWIPVSERLPKEGQVVLITNKNGNVKCGQYRGLFPSDAVNWWWWKKNTTEEVTAWMPLPEPYRGEEK